MARKLRAQYPGAIYHVMKGFLGTYTSRFNRRHKLFGHLFSGRYKALLVEQGLKRRRLSPEQLTRLGKAEPRKVAAAQRLRRETTMTWDWIAQRLGMGVGPYAASSVRRLSQRDEYAVLRDWPYGDRRSEVRGHRSVGVFWHPSRMRWFFFLRYRGSTLSLRPPGYTLASPAGMRAESYDNDTEPSVHRSNQRERRTAGDRMYRISAREESACHEFAEALILFILLNPVLACLRSWAVSGNLAAPLFAGGWAC